MKANLFYLSTVAFALSSLLLNACGDDSSSSNGNGSKMTVKDVADSVICSNGIAVTVKEVNDSTYAIMCDTDSVGYASIAEYEFCEVNTRQDSLGVDFICDGNVVGSVSVNSVVSNSSSSLNASSSSNAGNASSASVVPNSSETQSSTESSSSESAPPSLNGSSSSSSTGNSEINVDESQCNAELVLPDPLNFMDGFSKCIVSHEDSFGESEVWTLHVSLNQDQIEKLWNIQSFGFTPDKKHKNKGNTYVASGKKIAMNRKFLISFNLTKGENEIYEGEVTFTQGDLTCEEFVSVHPGEYECVEGSAVEIENVGVCGKKKFDKKYNFCAAKEILDLCGTADGYNVEFYDCVDDEVVMLYPFDEKLEFLEQYVTEIIGYESDESGFEWAEWTAISNVDESSLESFKEILPYAGFFTSSPTLYETSMENSEYGYSIEILPVEESSFYKFVIRMDHGEE